MTLWEKSLRIIGVIVLVLVAVIYLVERSILQRDLVERQRLTMAEHLRTARYVVDLELNHLDLILSDWSHWDGLYRFAADRNPAFLESDLTDEVFATVDLNLIVVLDANGQVIYARGLDPRQGSPADLPSLASGQLGELLPLAEPLELDEGRRGIALLDMGDMLVAARPILTSRRTGPAHGTVIMGRLLEGRLAQTLADVAQLVLVVTRTAEGGLPAGSAGEPGGLSLDQPMWVERRAGNLIAGHLLLPDVSGRPALVLTFEEGLDAGSYGRMMLYSLSTVLAVGALVLFLTILMGVEVMVLSRINSLRRQVGEVGSSADAAMRVKLEGHDEVAELAESINGMLAGLQEAHESLQRQEHELRQSEERYRSIFETAGTANVIVDADMTVLLVNPEFERLFGYSRADLEGKRKWSEFISEPDLGRMIEFNRLRQVAAGAAPRSYESSGNDRSGNLRDLLITVSPIPGTSRFIASALDITRRKRMEEELRQLKDFNEGIVEGVAEGLLIEDGAGKISFVNRALETMLGYSRSELVGWSWTRIVAPDQVNVIRERMSARGPGSSDVYETRFLDKAGRELPVLVSARPMQEDGHYAGVLTAVTDMREREKLEERLRQAQKLEMLGVIAGGIAHSFNNLLTVIRGNAELGLMEPDVPETLRHDLQVITGAAQRGALLTQQLLSFSRRRVLQPVPTDLNQRVAEFVELIRPLLGGDIQVAVDLAPGPCTILADASAIEQVLMNLSVNARDAMPQGGTLSVRTAERTVGEGDPDCRPGHGPGRYVLLSVSDTGQGIEPEAMAHLFEPFFSTKEVGKGTGLGLSVAYGIVQQHQGCIDVHSVPGQGARFDVYFPLFQKT